MVATAVRRTGVCLFGLALCVAVGCGGPGLTRANVDKIKLKESTKEDVDKLLGSPGTKLEGAEAKKYTVISMPGMPGGPGGKENPDKEKLDKELKDLKEQLEKATKGKSKEEAKKIQQEYQQKIDDAQKKLEAAVPKGPEFPGGFKGMPGPGGMPGGPGNMAEMMNQLLAGGEVYRWGDASKGVVCVFVNGKVEKTIPIGL
jgi:hypothetical protein